MRRHSRFRYAIEYAIALAAILKLEWAPLPLARWMARVTARLLDLAMPQLRRRAMHNLAMAMPELDAAARGRIADGVFASIARLLLVFSRLPRIHAGNVSRWIRYEGYEHYEQAKRKGKGVLFATAHMGNWELSAFAHALMSEPMNVVVRPLDNPWIDRLVERRRTGSGNHIIGKKEFARAILKALGANQAVGILIDQNSTLDNGVFVDFFGMPACTGATFARVAAHSGATVIPGFALWEAAEGRYVLRFYEPIAMTGDVVSDTQALQARLESVIRQSPDQWLWIHRRWKTRPPGQPPLY
jgi:Kdo2-lipid IVA lauroyltransferase/acyltransferase